VDCACQPTLVTKRHHAYVVTGKDQGPTSVTLNNSKQAINGNSDLITVSVMACAGV